MRILAAAVCIPLLSAQTSTASRIDARWQALSFLEGTWDAKTTLGSSAINASGSYTFQKELNGHVLARYSSATACTGPADSNCDHHDLLYLYQEDSGQVLKAIYFDNEGHVIHYRVATPAPKSVVLTSDPGAPGPQYRLVYELKGTSMQGKFQMRQPGQQEWTSYLEWSGGRK